MSIDTDIAIVGGGLNGCALALAFASGGLSVTIIDSLPVEQRKLPAFDGRSYALALASKNLLSALKMWDDLENFAQPMLEIKVTDGRAGEGASPFLLHFDHAEIEEGPVGYMVEDRHLRSAFLERIASTPHIKHLHATVTDQRTAAGTAELTADGQTISARMIIGCDGRGSGVAERAQIERSYKDYGQTALVAAIEHERPHNGVAHQFFMPAGPLAILPLTGNRSSIVWAEAHTRAADISAMDDASFIEALRPAFGDFLGELKVTGERFSYPLNLTVTEQLIASRIALVGDAAHGFHPIAGQGLNQGLRDVAALSEVVVDAKRRGEDIGSDAVLRRYSEWRRFDTSTLAFATDGFNTLFSNDNPFVRTGRDIGMGIIQAIPALRRSFMREAAGLTGDVPRLLKGRSL